MADRGGDRVDRRPDLVVLTAGIPRSSRPTASCVPGSCVAFEPNGDAREVACGQADGDDIVVEVLVPLDGTCPSGTVGHRDRLGLGIACVPT